MDNLPVHKVAGVKTAIETAGACRSWALRRILLDLNPIEMVFAKLKALLRKASERTVGKLWTGSGNCFRCFQPGVRNLILIQLEGPQCNLIGKRSNLHLFCV